VHNELVLSTILVLAGETTGLCYIYYFRVIRYHIHIHTLELDLLDDKKEAQKKIP
jgi:hypothetical protein